MGDPSQPTPSLHRTHAAKAAKYERRYAVEVVDDLRAMGDVDPALVNAALAAVEDLAFGRRRGKLLGERHITGNLTGLARLRFDLPGQQRPRFRIVYRLLEDSANLLPVIEVLAIGERSDHLVYRDTLARLGHRSGGAGDGEDR